MTNDGGFLSIKGPDGSTNTIKLMNGTELKINGKTYSVNKNGTVFCNSQEVKEIEVSSYQKEMLFNFANEDTKKGGYGFFNEEDMSYLKNIKCDLWFFNQSKGELVQTKLDNGEENFRISTPNSRLAGKKLEEKLKKDDAYAQKHWVRHLFGITREKYESNPKNKIDY